MKPMTSCAAFALTLALGAPALAQQPQAPSPAGQAMETQPAPSASPPVAPSDMAPSTDPMAPPAASPAAPSAGAAAADASVTVGMTVKDNTGAAIGSVSEVKTDAAGAKVATIQMGADVFAVDTSSLAVRDGAATINATQAELKTMLPKP